MEYDQEDVITILRERDFFLLRAGKMDRVIAQLTQTYIIICKGRGSNLGHLTYSSCEKVN